jgi:hypothetical protein
MNTTIASSINNQSAIANPNVTHGTNKKSVLISIRPDANLKEKLKHESDKTGATLNSLIS